MTDSRWDRAGTVAGFAQSPPNAVRLRLAADRLPQSATRRAIDLDYGAGRNTLPLARLGWRHELAHRAGGAAGRKLASGFAIDAEEEMRWPIDRPEGC